MKLDVAVIGGGQSAISCGYYLRRTDLNYQLFDKNKAPGGSWINYWDSLRLFSPSTWSSLPGVIMPGGDSYYPSRQEVIDYLTTYEEKYEIPIARECPITEVKKEKGEFLLFSENERVAKAKYVIDATGAVAKPKVPEFKGRDIFEGEFIHSIQYREPLSFRGKNVLIVGEGNSGAQILAEVSQLAGQVYWSTNKPPKFLPRDIDGRYLFDQATQLYEAKKQGKEYTPPSLGDIVMTPPVQEAYDRKVYKSRGTTSHFKSQSVVFSDGSEVDVDAVICCTGFRSDFSHFKTIDIKDNRGRVPVKNNQSTKCKGLFFVGHGNWTGFASATLIGVGRTAKRVINAIKSR